MKLHFTYFTYVLPGQWLLTITGFYDNSERGTEGSGDLSQTLHYKSYSIGTKQHQIFVLGHDTGVINLNFFGLNHKNN